MKAEELANFGRVKVVLRDYIRDVVRLAKTNLTKEDKNVNKNLYNSVRGEYDYKDGSATFFYEDYGVYQDKGVQGYQSSAKAPYSPFKYKKKMAKPEAILGWVTARRFQFRDRESGRFMSYASTAFLIARSIARTGIPATRWFESAWQKYLPKYIARYEEASAKDYEEHAAQLLNNRIGGGEWANALN